MKIAYKDIRNRPDVVRYLSETSPGWDHDVDNDWDAVAIVLFSAAVLATTEPVILALFTGYDLGFICAVAWNMRNNGLWTCTQYKHEKWSPENMNDQSAFWEEVSTGYGMQAELSTESDSWIDVGNVPFQPYKNTPQATRCRFMTQ